MSLYAISNVKFAVQFIQALLAGLVAFLPEDAQNLSESVFSTFFATILGLNIAA